MSIPEKDYGLSALKRIMAFKPPENSICTLSNQVSYFKKQILTEKNTPSGKKLYKVSNAAAARPLSELCAVSETAKVLCDCMYSLSTRFLLANYDYFIIQINGLKFCDCTYVLYGFLFMLIVVKIFYIF